MVRFCFSLKDRLAAAACHGRFQPPGRPRERRDAAEEGGWFRRGYGWTRARAPLRRRVRIHAARRIGDRAVRRRTSSPPFSIIDAADVW